MATVEIAKLNIMLSNRMALVRVLAKVHPSTTAGSKIQIAASGPTVFGLSLMIRVIRPMTAPIGRKIDAK
jgi:hypothetical protein